MNQPKKVGFWKEPGHPEYPEPLFMVNPNKTNDKNVLGVLTVMRIIMDNDAVSNTKRHAEQYPDQQVLQTKGVSICRFCGCGNGSREYTLGGFTWPEGYLHYLMDHNVQIDPNFERFIIEYAKECITVSGNL